VLIFIDTIPKGSTGKPARIGFAQRYGILESHALSAVSETDFGSKEEAVRGGHAAEHDSLAIASPTSSNGGGAPLKYAFLSGINYVVVFSVIPTHFMPLMYSPSYRGLLVMMANLTNFGMWLMFMTAGLSTHLTQSTKGDAFATPTAYFSFLWGRIQRVVLLIYVSQWATLLGAAISGTALERPTDGACPLASLPRALNLRCRRTSISWLRARLAGAIRVVALEFVRSRLWYHTGVAGTLHRMLGGHQHPARTAGLEISHPLTHP
jgi:hypothetical protein